jgi:prophage regulatory protein
MEHLIDAKSVFAMTSLSKASVYRGIKKGLFPSPVRTGERRVAWRGSDIEAWLEGLKPTLKQ